MNDRTRATITLFQNEMNSASTPNMCPSAPNESITSHPIVNIAPKNRVNIAKKVTRLVIEDLLNYCLPSVNIRMIFLGSFETSLSDLLTLFVVSKIVVDLFF